MRDLTFGFKDSLAKGMASNRLLFGAMAAMNIFIIVASLYLSYSLTRVFRASIASQDVWFERFEAYGNISAAVAELDSEGNLVFENLEVAEARSVQKKNQAEFDLLFSDIYRMHEHGLDGSERKILLQDLDLIKEDVATLSSESESVFAALDAKNSAAAARASAKMDLAYGMVNEKIAALMSDAAAFEQAGIQKDHQREEKYNGWGQWFALGAFSFVIIITVYGNFMARRMAASEALLVVQEGHIQASARMSALGTMAGGIAHEINNPLAIIIANADRLVEFAEEGDINAASVAKDAATISRTSLRIAKIVKGLRTFSRDGKDDPIVGEPVLKIIDETLDLCRAKLLSSGIEIRMNVTASNPIALCRSTEISQILLNLISNASDAVAESTEKWMEISVSNADGFVQIAVSDSGAGIPLKVREKIMNPFFTTKEVGKGTGLGLSISSSIATKHGGSLKLDPNATETRFVLTLLDGASQTEENLKIAS